MSSFGWLLDILLYKIFTVNATQIGIVFPVNIERESFPIFILYSAF